MEKRDPKPLYLTLAATTAVGVFFIPKATWTGASVMIACCLMTAFLSRERVEDERVEHLKLRAIRLALVAAAIVAFLHAWLMKARRHGNEPLQFLSGFDLLIITMLIALGLFHYWRWQDGRADKAG